MWDQGIGAVFMAVGVYTWLLVQGTLPRNPRNPEELAAWRKQWGGTFRWLSPALILYGAVRYAGIL